MKKILLTLMACMAISFALPPAARALTAADLVGKDVAMLMKGNFMQQSLYKSQAAGKIESRNGKLYITNFMGKGDVECYISGNTLAVPTNYMTKNGSMTYEFERNDGGPWVAYQWGQMVYPTTTIGGKEYMWFGYWVPDNSDILFQLTESNDGKYSFSCKQGIAVYEEDSVGNLSVAHFNGMFLTISDYNSTATEYKVNANGEYEPLRSYNAHVKIDGNNISIINWKNIGYLYNTVSNSYNPNNTIHGLDGTVNDNGIINFLQQESGADLAFTTVPSRNGFKTIASRYGYWYTALPNALPTVYKKYARRTAGNTTITGTLEAQGVSHNKSGVDNMWTTNGGDLKTFEGKSLILGEDEIYSTNSGVIAGSHADMTVFQINDIDVTHDASLKIDGFYFNNEEVYVQGSIRNRMNCQHHESYDLYMIPGNHYDLNNVETVAHHDTGLEGAVCVLTDLRPSEEPVDDYDEYDEYGEEGMIARAPSTANITLAHQVKWPEGIQKDASTYTFFLKSKYADDKNLEPTFLSMAAPGIVTGIGNLVDFNPDMIVRPVAGGVEVEGFDGMVEVYSVAGTCVFSGVADGVIELSQGTYIVRAAQRSWKVNVN